MPVRNRAAARETPVRTLPALAFDVVKVFSATMVHEREQLGERASQWLAARPISRSPTS